MTTRVLLVNPANRYKVQVTTSWDIRSEKQGLYPPLGLLYIAAAVKERTAAEVCVVDMLPEGLDYAGLREKIAAYRPDLVGVTAYTEIFRDALTVLRVAKEVNSKIITVMGGPHCMTFPEESAGHDAVDIVVMGEGEEVLARIIGCGGEREQLRELPGVVFRDGDGEIINNGMAPYIDDLDRLPFPARRLLPLDRYYCILGREKNVATISSTRGCPYNCIYCDIKIKKYRERSVANVVDEMEVCVGLGFREIWFVDDMFNLTTGRVTALAEEILARGLDVRWSFRGRVDAIDAEMLHTAAAAGCERIQFGIETGTDAKLQFLKKDTTVAAIRRAVELTAAQGIMTVGNFILGLPVERTRAEVEETIAFARSLPLDYAEFHLLKIWPGTELFDLAVARGQVRPDAWREYVLHPDREFIPEMWTEHFSRAELRTIIKGAFRKFYFTPRYIIRSLLRTRSWYELGRKLAGVRELLRR